MKLVDPVTHYILNQHAFSELTLNYKDETKRVGLVYNVSVDQQVSAD